MSKHRMAPAVESKKTPLPKAINVKKIIVICAVCVVAALVLTWAILGAVSANALLNPERNGLAYTDGPAEIGMVYETFEIKDFNGSDNIVGWWIPAQDYLGEITESSKTVIFSHNYQSNREMRETDGLFLFRHLVREGYNVITFDYTGSGNSKGKNYTFGVRERDELKLVVDYAADVREQTSIALYGFAFGSAAAISEGCADDRVTAILADSPFTDLQTVFFENLSYWSGLPDFLFTPYIKTLMNVFAGCDLSVSPLETVKNASGKSFLFIHGDKDDLFDSKNSSDLSREASSAENYAEYKIFEDGRHEHSFVDCEENYISCLLSFLEHHFE